MEFPGQRSYRAEEKSGGKRGRPWLRTGGEEMETARQGSTGLIFQALLVEVTLQWGSRGVGALVGDQWIPHLRAIPDGQLWGGGRQ